MSGNLANSVSHIKEPEPIFCELLEVERMSNVYKVCIEKVANGYWAFIQPSPGAFPDTPLFSVLRWILQQLNFGHFKYIQEPDGRITSLQLGKIAPFHSESLDAACEAAERRLQAVEACGVVAQDRESGTTPELKDLLSRVTNELGAWGRRNTEFHYGFELIKVLARLNKKTFTLEAPPIKGMADPIVLSYLHESTRCWLYGFHGATVALNRACLEEALKRRLAGAVHGELDSIIKSARASRLLDDAAERLAHKVRVIGNNFLHGKRISESDSKESMDATRHLLERLFSDSVH